VFSASEAYKRHDRATIFWQKAFLSKDL